MLKNKDCADFIKDLPGRVASDKNPLVEGGDILKVYDLINSPSQGGMVRAGAPGSVPGANFALGSVAGGNARIQIGVSYPGPATAKGDAPIGLHETIHHSGRNVYGDDVLAKAVSEMTGTPIEWRGQKLTGDPYKDVWIHSQYWNAELQKHCK
jgi:hypothetical protein